MIRRGGFSRDFWLFPAGMASVFFAGAVFCLMGKASTGWACLFVGGALVCLFTALFTWADARGNSSRR